MQESSATLCFFLVKMSLRVLILLFTFIVCQGYAAPLKPQGSPVKRSTPCCGGVNDDVTNTTSRPRVRESSPSFTEHIRNRMTDRVSDLCELAGSFGWDRLAAVSTVCRRLSQMQNGRNVGRERRRRESHIFSVERSFYYNQPFVRRIFRLIRRASRAGKLYILRRLEMLINGKLGGSVLSARAIQRAMSSNAKYGLNARNPALQLSDVRALSNGSTDAYDIFEKESLQTLLVLHMRLSSLLENSS